MKLLGWMHRKFRQGSQEPFKDLSSGPTCSCFSAGARGHHKLSPVVPTRTHGCPTGDRHVPSPDKLLPFDGLLSIGTLGSVDPTEGEELREETAHETGFQEPAALVAVEEIANREESEAASEADLMAVSAEMEKVLTEAAQEEDNSMPPSARPGHVSGTGKQANEACPLQEYLFAGPTGRAATRKEKRASLRELFMAEEEGGGLGGEGNEKDGVNMMKNKMFAGGGGRPKDASAVKTAKLQKIMQIFHRKIHPENIMTSRKSTKCGKNKNKYVNYCIGGGGDASVTPPRRACTNENTYGSDQSSPLRNENDSASGREHWIKTDANCEHI